MGTEKPAPSTGAAPPLSIEVSREFLTELLEYWSPAVNIMAIQHPDGRYEMVMRKHICPSNP